MWSGTWKSAEYLRTGSSGVADVDYRLFPEGAEGGFDFTRLGLMFWIKHPADDQFRHSQAAREFGVVYPGSFHCRKQRQFWSEIHRDRNKALSGARFGEPPIVFADRRLGTSKIDSKEAISSLWIIFTLGLRNLFRC